MRHIICQRFLVSLEFIVAVEGACVDVFQTSDIAEIPSFRLIKRKPPASRKRLRPRARKAETENMPIPKIEKNPEEEKGV